MGTEANHSDPRYYERDYALDRLIMLSDGVFAIAMTLMALEVRAPTQWDHTVPGLLVALAGPFQAFFWSFFTTALFWATHRRMFERYTRSTSVLSIINLVLLGEITLVPVATRILGELAYTGGALSLYLGLFALIGLTNAINYVYANLAGIQKPRAGGGTMAAVAAIQVTSLGFLSAAPGLHYLLLFMPILAGLSRLIVWLGRKFDAPDAHAPLPVAGAVDKVPPTGL